MAYFGQATPATGTDAEMLALWRACEAAISVSGQSYRIGELEYTFADLKQVAERIAYYETKVATATRRSAVSYPVRGRAI